VRRKFKGSRFLRVHKRKTREEYLSQRLGEGNSSRADILEVMRRNSRETDVSEVTFLE
jgi:hypothetical protein